MQEPGQRGRVVRLANVLTALTVAATVGLLTAYVAIALHPALPINPYPPPTSSPSLRERSRATRGAATPSSLPSASPTRVVLVTPTPLQPATPTPSPTPAMPFTARVELRSSPNCTMGLAGTVLDEEGEDLEDYPVHIWGPGMDTIKVSGSAPDHGLSGWAVSITRTTELTVSTWYVQLHRRDVAEGNPPLSSVIRVELSGACEENLALISFEEQ